mmetsp:Transcript_146208/g.364581  ORF Transcript_146208/g.364581 Transcript_146208/m.364581 type:complete len:252 (+) Transcript_146208:1049-1804(+)
MDGDDEQLHNPRGDLAARPILRHREIAICLKQIANAHHRENRREACQGLPFRLASMERLQIQVPPLVHGFNPIGTLRQTRGTCSLGLWGAATFAQSAHAWKAVCTAKPSRFRTGASIYWWGEGVLGLRCRLGCRLLQSACAWQPEDPGPMLLFEGLDRVLMCRLFKFLGNVLDWQPDHVGEHLSLASRCHHTRADGTSQRQDQIKKGAPNAQMVQRLDVLEGIIGHRPFHIALTHHADDEGDHYDVAPLLL